MSRSKHLTCLASAWLVAVLAACGGDSVTNPQFEPEIVNLTDSFAFQVTDLTNVSENVTYTWQHTGTLGNVNQSSSVSAGTATLTILDAQGTQVYSRNLSENGTFTTNAGTDGSWTIQVALSGVSGTLNFRVEKP